MGLLIDLSSELDFPSHLTGWGWEVLLLCLLFVPSGAMTVAQQVFEEMFVCSGLAEGVPTDALTASSWLCCVICTGSGERMTLPCFFTVSHLYLCALIPQGYDIWFMWFLQRLWENHPVGIHTWRHVVRLWDPKACNAQWPSLFPSQQLGLLSFCMHISGPSWEYITYPSAFVSIFV